MTTSTATAKTINRPLFYSTMSNQNDRLFQDEQIQRYDTNTIRDRYGDNWKSFVSNVREVAQPDGSIVKEYMIEDPTLLNKMQTPSRQLNSISSATISDDEYQLQHQHHHYPSSQTGLKNNFAEIKAKFEQKQANVVTGSPSASSAASNPTATRPNSHQLSDQLYAKHRSSNESLPSNRTNLDIDSLHSSHQPLAQSNGSKQYERSQSIGSEKTKGSSVRRLNSADEADEEVRRIHRQGEELRRYKQELSPISASNEIPDQSRVQYEVVDEDGNPLAIDGIQNLIQMSGVHAREVPQPDGTIIKEYVIDDPQVLSKFRSQQSQQASPIAATTYKQQPINTSDAPPPPPRVPLRQPLLFRQGASTNDNMPVNIRQIRVLEPQRRYEFVTSIGRRVQFAITNIDDYRGQPISDTDVRELTDAIDARLGVLKPAPTMAQPSTTTPFTHPKTWNPSVDLTQRGASQRQRIGSDTQHPSNNSQHMTTFHQAPNDLVRSASYGALNHASYVSQAQQQHTFNQPAVDWSLYQQHNLQGQIEPSAIRQPNQIRQQNNGPFQTTAQFLPQQQQPMTTRSMNSPPINHNIPVYYQQSNGYPYQGQQQAVRYATNVNNYDVNPARLVDSNARI